MKIKIAALSDTHFSGSCPLPERKAEIADILLLRAVHRINRFIKPDVTLILGDLVNDGAGPEGGEQLRRLRDITGLLKSPSIIIPGNHDGDIDAFYKILPRPEECTDIKGVRFLPFLDQEQPGFNAVRSQRDIERMAEARSGHEGPIISLQHVPLLPPDNRECLYNLTNASSVIDEMKRSRIKLAISGHYHPGCDTMRRSEGTFIVVPALCESPFIFLEIDVDGDDVDVKTHTLKLPSEAQLFDWHVHTTFAYCSENMDISRAIMLAREFGLEGLAFSEHSGHLYFDRSTYCDGRFLHEGISAALPAHSRMADYLSTGMPCPARRGLEVDSDFHGRLLAYPDDMNRVEFVIGAVHALPELLKPHPDKSRVAEEFLAITSRFLSSGIKVLAHPFRIFRRAGLEVPDRLFEPIADMLLANGVAAEINFHTNEPALDFLKLCLDRGVKIAFGSDAHNLYEVGEFAPHLELLHNCGCDGNLNDILLKPEAGS